MKKKFISFLTVLALILTMMPMQVYGEDEAVPDAPNAIISLAEIAGVSAPVKGETPVASIDDTAEYTASIAWSGAPVVFAADTEYTATIEITPKAGYTLEGLPEDFFKVAGAVASNDAGSGTVTAVFPKTASDEPVTPEPTPDAAISIAVIAGVLAPATGETPVASLPGSAEYSASITWSNNPVVFEPDTAYTATITVTPLTGYTLTGVPANFFTVEGAAATNDAGSGVITAVFPQTGPPLPPNLVGAATNEDGDIVTLTFDKAMADPSSDMASFAVKINGYNDYQNAVSKPIALSSAAINTDSAEAIDLILAEPLQRGDIVTVDYTPGTVTAADTTILQAFVNEPVTNRIPVEIDSNLEGAWEEYENVGWWGEDFDQDYYPPYLPTGDDPRGKEYNKHIYISGSAVTFYGNGKHPFVDFLYLPSDDDAAKSFHYKLSLINTDWHTLEGGGFLFNTEIENGILSGYAVLFTQGTSIQTLDESSDATLSVKLYEFDNVDVKAMHTNFGYSDGLYQIKGVTELEIDPVNVSGAEHDIYLETSAEMMSMWDGDNPLITNYELPSQYGYGVGLIGSYTDHGCSSLSYFTFNDLSIEGIANLSAELDGTEADLSFTAPAGAKSVTVEKSTDGVNFTPSTLLDPINSSSTTATVTGLNEYQTYFFRLVIEEGKYAGYSRIATALYTGPIKNLAAAPDDGKVHLTFTVPYEATNIEVMQSTDGGINFTPAVIEGDLTGLPTSATVLGLTNGQQYWFKLVVAGGANEGESNIASATPAIQSQPHSSGGGGSSKPVAKNIFRFEIGDTNSYLTSGSAIEKKIPMDTAPIIYEDRTLLPIRFVVEPLGGTVAWDEKEQKVTITLDKTTIELWIGNNTAKVNGIEKMIDPLNKNVVPIIVDPGRTMLPLRFISESLGCTVDWDAVNKKITVTDWD